MNTLIDWCMDRTRTMMAGFVVILFVGMATYITIPKEADPDIDLPFFGVSVFHEGISAEDAERLLVRPLETELRAVEGLEEMSAFATENYVQIQLEFDSRFDKTRALSQVREKVDLARPKLPADAEEPVVMQFNAQLFPVLGVVLGGNLPERTMLHVAHQIRDRVKALPTVMSVDLIGARDELLEVIIDPAKMESYGISSQELFQAATQNNRLIAAGAIQSEQARFAVKVPGLFETREDVLGLPIRADGEGVITLGDIADIRRTFKDTNSIAKINGEKALGVWVTKRLNENVVLTTGAVREVVEEMRPSFPPGLQVHYTNDMSFWVYETQESLQSAVSTAIALVMIIIVAALGLRSGLLVGIAIPSSFLFAFVLMGIFDQTLNMMVMFGLVLSVGLLVDGTIVVVELADRKMAEGLHRKEAYAHAAKRMAWPIISSTATTLAAFVPLLAWPGTTGEFMGYLPKTMIFTLTASLVVALIILPVLGSIFGKVSAANKDVLSKLAIAEGGDPRTLTGYTGVYSRFIDRVIRHPVKVFLVALVVIYGVIAWYGSAGKGVEFFGTSDPLEAVVVVRARGNLAPHEQIRLTERVEQEILHITGIETAFTEAGISLGTRGMSVASDAIATINLEFSDWRTRGPSSLIMEEIRERTKDIPGIKIEIYKRVQGPPIDKELDIEFSSTTYEAIEPVVAQVRNYIDDNVAGLVDVEDSRPLPGIDWQIKIDREQAARFGTDITTVGAVVQLVTNGIMIGEYRPDDSLEEIDIRVRYPEDYRNIETLDNLKVASRDGQIPISNFVTRKAAPKVNQINRSDGVYTMRLKANPAAGEFTVFKVQQIQEWMATQTFDPRVQIKFRGANKEQAESAAFLGNAMLASLFLMCLILITQFNSFWHSIIILSSIVLSTVGVLFGIIVRDQSFSVVMTGTGIIALAGIVVNNNIVLVDTFHHLLKQGEDPLHAIVRTGAQRLRPVLLTTITTIMGLLPMAWALNINFITRDITYDAPTGQMFVLLSNAVVFGLAFATVLTLVVTPSALALPYVWKGKGAKLAFWRKNKAEDGTPEAAE